MVPNLAKSTSGHGSGLSPAPELPSRHGAVQANQGIFDEAFDILAKHSPAFASSHHLGYVYAACAHAANRRAGMGFQTWRTTAGATAATGTGAAGLAATGAGAALTGASATAGVFTGAAAAGVSSAAIYL